MVKVRCNVSAIILHVTWKKMDSSKVNALLWVTSVEPIHACSKRVWFNHGIDPKEKVVLTLLAYHSSTLHYKLFSGNKRRWLILKHWLLLANKGGVRIWRLWHFVEQPSNQPRKKAATDWSRYVFCNLTISTYRAVSANSLWSTTCMLFSFDASCCIYIKNALWSWDPISTSHPAMQMFIKESFHC